MKHSRSTSRLRKIALDVWNAEAAKWDGIAHAWHPGLRRMINMDWYKETGSERIMERLDALPSGVRQAVYNSPDGDIDNTIQRLRAR